MAVPFLHNIDLNQNELLNAKVHTDSDSAKPSNPGTGSIWFDTDTNLLKIYRGGDWNNLYVKTEAIADGGTNLATADQIHTFVTTYVASQITLEDLDFSGDSGTGAVDLNSQTFAITGDTGITTTASGQGLSIDLDDTANDMTATNSGVYGSATAIPVITVDRQGRLTAATTAAISTTLTVDGDSTSQDVSLADDDLQILGTTGEIDVAVTKVSTDVKATIGLADTITGNRTFSNDVTISGGLTVVGKTTTNEVEIVSTSNGVQFEGTAADGNDAVLKSVVADSDKTYTLPNITGYVPILTNDPGTTAISATVAEINKIDGFTGDHNDLNYAKDLRATGVTASEYDTLDGITATTTELNIMDGDTSATSTTVADADRFVMNDAGTMKQVAASDVKTYINAAIAAREFKVELDANESSVTKSSNKYTVTHSLGTRDVLVQVIEKGDSASTNSDSKHQTVHVDIDRPDDAGNTVTAAFGQAVTDGDYKILITKIG
tara:strand:- start:12 stop:1490 length:1479 start_codon:yes stop_codon:yes gene_type:complete